MVNIDYYRLLSITTDYYRLLVYRLTTSGVLSSFMNLSDVRVRNDSERFGKFGSFSSEKCVSYCRGKRVELLERGV